MIVYKLTNTVTNKIYVGKTKQSLEKRINGHLRYSKEGKPTKLTNSINKYGWDKFKAEILEEVTDGSINEREQYWIKTLNTLKEGLNSTEGGDGGDNSRFIDYTKRKYSYTPELREKRRQQLINNNPNNLKGVREKISLAKKGKKQSEEHKKKIQKSRMQNGFSFKGKNNPKYVEVSEVNKKIIMENYKTVKTKSKLIELTGLSYFMINKVIKQLING